MITARITLSIISAAMAVLAVITAVPAASEDDSRWVRRSVWSSCDFWGANCVRYRIRDYEHRRRYVQRVYRRHEPRVMAYVRRDRDDWETRRDERAQCIDTVVDVVSTEHQGEDNARESARKLWMARTQWNYGGQYMALDEAADVRWRCGPSNAHDTMSGRLAEAAGKLVGREGQNVRCALWARPCRAQREADQNGRRR